MKHQNSTPHDFAMFYHNYTKLNHKHSAYLFTDLEAPAISPQSFNKAEFYSAIGKGNIDDVNRILSENFIYIIYNLDQSSLRTHKKRIYNSIEMMILFQIQNGMPDEVANYIRTHYMETLRETTTEQDANLLHYVAIYEMTSLSPYIKKLLSLSEPLRLCITYMYHLDMEKIKLTTLAEKFRINERILSQCFYNEFGMSFSMFFHKQRIQVSKYLLVFTRFSPVTIAEILHYTSDTYYCKLFKDITGVSPTDFRKQFQGEKYILSV
ncbi:MAG: helix-turn-helix domain-containing protein [bacterium]|nr:helix-turn-helix domain-containing protein [bacterium]